MEIKHVIKYKVILLIFISIFSSSYKKKKKKHPIYIEFKENSGEKCNVDTTRKGSFHYVNNVNKYGKLVQENGDIYFYICREKFVYVKSQMEKRIVSKKFLNNKKLMNYDDLVIWLNKMEDKYPMGYRYPSKEFPKIFIPIKLSNCKMALYEVKWHYYIE